jgi:hypothetical protein
MAAIAKGTALYIKENERATLFLRNFLGKYNDTENKFPNTPFSVVQTYYGDENGAASSPEDKYYQRGEQVGVAHGEVITIANEEYQIVETTAIWRERPGTFSGWFGIYGAGIYKEFTILTAIKTDKLSTDAVTAQENVNQRENADKIAKDKAAKDKADLAKSLAAAGTTPLTGNSSGGTNINITNIIIYVFAFLGLIIGGVLWWKGKQNKVSNPKTQ